MKNHLHLIIASIIALVLAVAIIFEVTHQKNVFDKSQKTSGTSTQGYDQQFIGMVNTLEQELTMQARFGYPGGKDPLTGKRRQIVGVHTSQLSDSKVAATGNNESGTSKALKNGDSIRLTAIIYDENSKKRTAILMVGERSFSVDVGDKVLDRRVVDISEQVLRLESPTQIFIYDIMGKQSTLKK